MQFARRYKRRRLGYRGLSLLGWDGGTGNRCDGVAVLDSAGGSVPASSGCARKRGK